MNTPTPSSRLPDNPSTLAQRIRMGERRALATAITLSESSRTDHRQYADTLLQVLSPYTGHALRLGISGAPGVGKSTLIEALGCHLISIGKRPAVLAIDPSSSINGGSILGDKTRMEKLSAAPEAFIRPSPTAGSLGGVTAHTRETILLCEAAGFDVIIVETVGVGQNELAVAHMTDCFLLMQSANTGDTLQAIKKGIVELADIVVYNKIDIDPQASQQAIEQMKSTLQLLRTVAPQPVFNWAIPVLGIAAINGTHIEILWQTIQHYADQLAASNTLSAKRIKQNSAWMHELIHHALHHRFFTHPKVIAQLPVILDALAKNQISPQQASSQLLAYGDQK